MAMRMTILAALAIVPLLGGSARSQALYDGPWCAIVLIGEGSVAERCSMPAVMQSASFVSCWDADPRVSLHQPAGKATWIRHWPRRSNSTAARLGRSPAVSPRGSIAAPSSREAVA